MKSCGALGEGRGNTGRFPVGLSGIGAFVLPLQASFSHNRSFVARGPCGRGWGEGGVAWETGPRSGVMGGGAGPSSCEVGYGCSRACEAKAWTGGWWVGCGGRDHLLAKLATVVTALAKAWTG